MAQNELFNLVKPESYNCRIRKYVQGHSTMYIWITNVENTSDKFFLIFGSVAYFSGQMSWKGADFVLSPQDEMLRVARKIDHLNRYSDEELMGHPKRLKLYEIELAQDRIQILARGVTRSNSSDIDFKG